MKGSAIFSVSKLQILVFVAIACFATSTSAQISFYASVETTSTATVDSQDDAWRTNLTTSYPTTQLSQVAPPAAGTYAANRGVTMTTSSGIGIRVSTLDMDGGALFGGTTIAGNITISSSATMQAGAPKPTIAALPNTGTLRNHYNELIGSNASRNAILFEFMDSGFTMARTLRGFGAWFGDVEGRSDFTNATVRLFDASGVLLNSFDVGSNANVLPTAPINGNQINCASANNGCGNNTTRWIGYVDSNTTPQVAYMLIIVGDPNSGGDGKSEHLSFAGQTIAVDSPNIQLTKTCSWPSNCVTQSQLPGTELTYKIVFANAGGMAAQEFILKDPIPANTDFKIGSAAMNTGTTGLTFVTEYSNNNGSTWTYTPVSGGGGADLNYDRNVTNIRWRVTAGSLSFLSPNNTGDISFVVKIR